MILQENLPFFAGGWVGIGVVAPRLPSLAGVLLALAVVLLAAGVTTSSSSTAAAGFFLPFPANDAMLCSYLQPYSFWKRRGGGLPCDAKIRIIACALTIITMPNMWIRIDCMRILIHIIR